MKIAPVSADMLIKLTLIAAAVGAVWYAGKTVSGAASAAWDPLKNAVVGSAHYVNPFDSENIVNSLVDKAVQALSSVPGQTLGGAVYDVVNPNPLGLGQTATRPMHDTYQNPDGFAIY